MAAQVSRCICLSICDVTVDAVPATLSCSQERVGHWWPEALSHVWLTRRSQGGLNLVPWNHGNFEYSVGWLYEE